MASMAPLLDEAALEDAAVAREASTIAGNGGIKPAVIEGGGLLQFPSVVEGGGPLQGPPSVVIPAIRVPLLPEGRIPLLCTVSIPSGG